MRAIFPKCTDENHIVAPTHGSIVAVIQPDPCIQLSDDLDSGNVVRHPCDEPNGALLAAAPDLFRLLRDARAACLNGRIGDLHGILTGDICAEVIERVEAARTTASEVRHERRP